MTGRAPRQQRRRDVTNTQAEPSRGLPDGHLQHRKHAAPQPFPCIPTPPPPDKTCQRPVTRLTQGCVGVGQAVVRHVTQPHKTGSGHALRNTRQGNEQGGDGEEIGREGSIKTPVGQNLVISWRHPPVLTGATFLRCSPIFTVS